MRYLVVSVLVAVIGFWFFYATGDDDSHITYWPAHTLATTGEIVNYSGERLEQSSTLLYTVILAGVHALTGLPIVWVGKILPILFCVLALYLIQREIAQVLDTRWWVWVGLMSVISPALPYWSYSGMETTLTLLCMTGLFITYRHVLQAPRLTWQAGLWSGLVMIALVMVRPEMPVVLTVINAGLCAFLLLRRFLIRPSGASLDTLLYRSAGLLLLGLVISAGLFMWRYAYFGQWFPQPVYAKTGSSAAAISGIQYLTASVLSPPAVTTMLMRVVVVVLSLGSFMYLLKSPLKHLRVQLALLFVGVYAAYIVFSGGDWMVLARFLVPILPLFFFLVAYVLSYSKLSRAIKNSFIGVSIVLQLSGYLFWPLPPLNQALQLYPADSTAYNTQAFTWFERMNPWHFRDIPMIYHLDRVLNDLAPDMEEPLVLYSGQMGMIPYYVFSTQQAEIDTLIDKYGLAHRFLLECPTLLDDIDRSSLGLLVSYEFYAQHQDEIVQCGISRPHLIYDLDSQQIAFPYVEAAGYTILYHQYNSRVPAIESDGLNQFIAVRNDLLPLLDADWPQTLDIIDWLYDE